MLHLPDSTINQIAQRIKLNNVSESDYQQSCCISMLTEWLKQSANTTVTEFIKVLECPAVTLNQDVIDNVKSILECKPKCMQNKRMILHPPPDMVQIEFMKMLSEINKLLNNSNKNLNKVLDDLSFLIDYNNIPMLDSAFLNNITSWKTLIDKFIEKKLCTLFDVEWLIILTKDIVECPRAVARIEEYKSKTRNVLLLNRIPWERNPDHSAEGIVQVTTNELCQTVTFQDYDKSKDSATAVLEIDKTSLLPHSCTVSSVSYNWVVSLKLISRLKLPNSITKSVKSMCEAANVTQISILRKSQKTTLVISHLSLKKGT